MDWAPWRNGWIVRAEYLLQYRRRNGYFLRSRRWGAGHCYLEQLLDTVGSGRNSLQIRMERMVRSLDAMNKKSSLMGFFLVLPLTLSL
jgi:hypothetical protein